MAYCNDGNGLPWKPHIFFLTHIQRIVFQYALYPESAGRENKPSVDGFKPIALHYCSTLWRLFVLLFLIIKLWIQKLFIRNCCSSVTIWLLSVDDEKAWLDKIQAAEIKYSKGNRRLYKVRSCKKWGGEKVIEYIVSQWEDTFLYV